MFQDTSRMIVATLKDAAGRPTGLTGGKGVAKRGKGTGKLGGKPGL
jgi:hypothetical protein